MKKTVLIFISLLFLSTSSYSHDGREYREFPHHRTHRGIIYVVPRSDGFIDCLADEDGFGGICEVYDGYRTVIKGTYYDVLQEIKPNSIFKGYSVEGSSIAGKVIIHIYYSYR